jgi:hypothetical protein
MAPQGAEAPAQYGPRIAAIIVYLYLGQFLSKQRTAQALAELFGIPLSSGTVAGITARAAGRLGGFLEHARDQIAASDVAGFDETGFRVNGKLHWVHCARTGKYTLLMVHPRRGTEAMEAMGVLPRFDRVAVHDAWAPYDTYTAPDHQLCCAHALRELQAVTDVAAGDRWCWATQAAEALTAMQALVAEAIRQGRHAPDPATLAAQIHLYRSAALAGASQTAARSGALDRRRRRRHHRPALPARQRPVGRAVARRHHSAHRAQASHLTDPATQTRWQRHRARSSPTKLSCTQAARRSAVLPYRRDMPARKRPTPEDTVTARRVLLDGLARDADIFELVSELAPLHPRDNTFPGEVFIGVAADALDWCRASRADPLPLEGLRERFLPECTFRGRENTKLQYAVLAAAALHGGTEPDLLDEVAWWQTDDFWQYALFAAVAYIRAAASRAGVPVRQACQDLGERPGHPTP